MNFDSALIRGPVSEFGVDCMVLGLRVLVSFQHILTSANSATLHACEVIDAQSDSRFEDWYPIFTSVSLRWLRILGPLSGYSVIMVFSSKKDAEIAHGPRNMKQLGLL